MPKEKKPPAESFESRLKEACERLVFVTETDSDVFPVFGKATRSTAAPDVLAAIGVSASDEPQEVAAFEEFFLRLTTQKEWFDSRQKTNAERFGALKRILENELTGLKVYRIGKIRITIYVLGLDDERHVAGVKMNAIET